MDKLMTRYWRRQWNATVSCWLGPTQSMPGSPGPTTTSANAIPKVAEVGIKDLIILLTADDTSQVSCKSHFIPLIKHSSFPTTPRLFYRLSTYILHIYWFGKKVVVVVCLNCCGWCHGVETWEMKNRLGWFKPFNTELLFLNARWSINFHDDLNV